MHGLMCSEEVLPVPYNMKGELFRRWRQPALQAGLCCAPLHQRTALYLAPAVSYAPFGARCPAPPLLRIGSLIRILPTYSALTLRACLGSSMAAVRCALSPVCWKATYFTIQASYGNFAIVLVPQCTVCVSVSQPWKPYLLYFVLLWLLDIF